MRVKIFSSLRNGVSCEWILAGGISEIVSVLLWANNALLTNITSGCFEAILRHSVLIAKNYKMNNLKLS